MTVPVAVTSVRLYVWPVEQQWVPLSVLRPTKLRLTNISNINKTANRTSSLISNVIVADSTIISSTTINRATATIAVLTLPTAATTEYTNITMMPITDSIVRQDHKMFRLQK